MEVGKKNVDPFKQTSGYGRCDLHKIQIPHFCNSASVNNILFAVYNETNKKLNKNLALSQPRLRSSFWGRGLIVFYL